MGTGIVLNLRDGYGKVKLYKLCWHKDILWNVPLTSVCVVRLWCTEMGESQEMKNNIENKRTTHIPCYSVSLPSLQKNTNFANAGKLCLEIKRKIKRKWKDIKMAYHCVPQV